MSSEDSENRPPVAASITLPPRSNNGQSSPLQFTFPNGSNRSLPEATTPNEDDGKSVASSSSAGIGSSTTDTSATANRKPAVYPHNLAQKQARKFARSAEKRQSIHMLGSIEHLQHHFTKFGLASKVAPDLKGKLQPAVGPLSTTSPTTPTPLPLSPLPPVVVERAPYPLTANIKVDLVELRKEVVESLKAAEGAWKTGAGSVEEKEAHIFILDLLKTTVSAIRHVRTYSLALPRTSLGGQLENPALRRASESTPKARPRHSISTPSRPAPAPTNTNGHNDLPDPLTPVRKAALDVLTGLRAIEERSRVEGSNCASDDTGISCSGFPSRAISPALSNHSAVAQPPATIDWTAEDDRDEAFFFAERGGDIDEETRKPWEERLGSGGERWSYRDDVTLESLEKEKEMIRRYFDVVETVIFPAERAERGDERAWNVKAVEAARRRQSGGGRSGTLPAGDVDMLDEVEEEIEGVDRDEVSMWASGYWKGTEMERLHEFLLRHLPLDLGLLIPSPMHDNFEARFLTRLSDGYLVILGFNTAIDRAAASWGHIAADDVYDTLDQDAATFRKVANLKCWGAALKLRYGIPLQVPAEPAPVTSIVPLQPSSETAAPDKPPQRRVASGSQSKVEGVAYDPAIIARKEEGWEKTFGAVLGKWMDAVASEARKEQ